MKTILTAAVALSVLAGSVGAASAQPQRHDDRYEQRGPDRHDDRRDDRRAESQWERRAEQRFNAGRYKAPKGYQARAWRRGDRLPAAYRGKSYVVDYRRYRLAPPPRGYQYVRVGDDVILTAVATGVVASIITQLFN